MFLGGPAGRASPLTPAALPATIEGVAVTSRDGEPMRYLLTGLLVVVAAGAVRADNGSVRVGMTGDQTDKVLGRPEISILYGCRQAGSLSVYLRTDWLGGEEKMDGRFRQG